MGTLSKEIYDKHHSIRRRESAKSLLARTLKAESWFGDMCHRVLASRVEEPRRGRVIADGREVFSPTLP